MNHTFIATLVTGAFFLAACGGEEDVAPVLNSGIEGEVFLGPQCPVVQQASPCPDLPFEATIDILTADRSRRVATVQSDADGRFRVDLEPGSYFVFPLPPDPGSPFPVASADTVTVEAGKYAKLTISYDTGIR
jgi:hypothetical protein